MASTGKRVFGAGTPQISALSISKNSGRQILMALDRGDLIVAGCWLHEKAYWDLASEGFVGLLAVSLVMLGAWHSVEDLRRPETKAKFNEEVFAVEESSGFHFVFFGSLMLTVLFFLMKYLIYVLLFLFATGAVSTTTMLLEPILAAWFPSLRAQKACSLPKRLANLFGCAQDHSWTDAISECIGAALSISFLLFRNNEQFGWFLQDAIAIMLLLTI